MEQQRTRLDFIDALRGVAILGVLAVHTGLALPDLPPVLVSMTNFGSIGVQLFFVLSSLTLLSVYRSASFSAADFYLRRFFRIAPAFYLAGILYASLDRGLENVAVHSAFVTLTFTQVWFPEAVNSIVPGGWSISVEAAFYLLFPLVLFGLTSLARATIATMAAFILAAAWNVATRYLLGGSYSQEIIDDFIFFSFFWNLPAFLLGAVLFHALPAVKYSSHHSHFPSIALLLVCVFLVLAAIGVQPLRTRFVSILLLAAMTLLVGVTHTPVLVNTAMRRLGEISYSVYLAHFGVLPLAATCVSLLLGSARPSVQWGVLFVLVLTVSSLVSISTWRLVEQPGIALGRQIARALSSAAPELIRSRGRSSRREVSSDAANGPPAG